MEKPSETPPFWVQPGNTPRPMRRTSGAIVAVLLLLLAAAILLFFAVPSVLSLLVQIFKPNTVRRGWDTLNLVLVLFAIVCGFLGRNSGDAETPVADRSFSTPSQRRHASSASTPRYWFKSPDRTPMLRRNSSSYPELRQDAHWAVAPEDQWRFSDDTLVSQYRVWGYDSDRLRRQPSNRVVDGWYFADTPISGRLQDGSPAATPPSQPQMRVTEEKPDDSENGSEKNTEPEAPPHTSRTPPEPRSPAAPATPPSLKVRRRRAKHSFESQPRRDWARNPAKSVSDVGNMEPIAAESPPPPPQQPPSGSGSGSGSGSRLGQASRKSDQKRVGLSSSSSSTKEFFASLYHQRKRKRKQRQKSVDDLESVLRFSPSTASTTPPPPPPPPPSLFQNLFASKKAKSKRTHSIPPPPSPPPPPPPVRSTINALKHERRGTLAQSDPEPLPEHKPPVWMAESFVSADEGVNSGGESPSPWIPIPPPTPPPPPFRMPELKFAAVGGGDFVRLLSEWSFSSRSASPEPDQSEPEPTEESGSSTAAAAAAFCPSPDVDTKADSFIARFRAGLRLEKVNSVNEKQGLGLSGLGPRPGPDPTP